MERALYAAVVCIALLAGCQPAGPPKHVVIDDWWSVDYAADYANGACPTELSKAVCITNSKASVRDFEAEIVSAFATDSHCHGIAVATYEGPTQKNPPPIKDTESYWTLMVDFTDPAQSKQRWSLIGKNPSALQGLDEPRSIARRICIALNKEGAEVDP